MGGTLYCSEVTRRLLLARFDISGNRVVALSFGETLNTALRNWTAWLTARVLVLAGANEPSAVANLTQDAPPYRRGARPALGRTCVRRGKLGVCRAH